MKRRGEKRGEKRAGKIEGDKMLRNLTHTKWTLCLVSGS